MEALLCCYRYPEEQRGGNGRTSSFPVPVFIQDSKFGDVNVKDFEVVDFELEEFTVDVFVAKDLRVGDFEVRNSNLGIKRKTL